MRELVIPNVADAEEEVADFVAVLARVLAALAMANPSLNTLVASRRLAKSPKA
jgi:hypothetical protein